MPLSTFTNYVPMAFTIMTNHLGIENGYFPLSLAILYLHAERNLFEVQKCLKLICLALYLRVGLD